MKLASSRNFGLMKSSLRQWFIYRIGAWGEKVNEPNFPNSLIHFALSLSLYFPHFYGSKKGY